MTSYAKLFADFVGTELGSELARLVLTKQAKGSSWRSGDASFEVRPVRNTKALDPYSGGEFTLEFERSATGKFLALGGTTRIGQMLDAEQTLDFIAVQNAIIDRLPTPPLSYIEDVYHESLRPTYLQRFEPIDAITPNFWMRFRTPEDLADWAELLARKLPSVVGRARELTPGTMYLGKSLSW